jgi:ABC-type antimicrobial peptide transport system permease subunit
VQAGDAAILVGLDTFRTIMTDPQAGAPDTDKEVLKTILATPNADVDEEELASDLRKRYGTSEGLGVDSTAETIKTTLEEARTGQIFLIVLTILTSVLAIFGVFAVIYVSVYGRRGEIGMLKAMGSSGRRLLTIFVGEAMVLTLSATLTGVVAGVVLAYVLRLSDGFSREIPTQFAVDWIVVSAQLGLMVLTSLVSAVAATHSYRRMKAVEVFRTL